MSAGAGLNLAFPFRRPTGIASPFPFRRLRHFIRDARAGATAVVAAAVVLMTVGAGAVIADHLLLVDKRDTLKSAIDAAGIAATAELGRLLDQNPNLTDAEIESALVPVARRYIELNLDHLPEDRLTRAKVTLAVELAVDRVLRTVDVDAAADLGGTLLSESLPMLKDTVPSGATRAGAQVESLVEPVEVVLAIDVSKSMDRQLNSHRACDDCADSRMNVVKRAASRLVDILAPSAENRVAIGVVPWHHFVRLDADTADTWETNRWAVYPTSRLYPQPYICGWNECSPPPPAFSQNTAPSPPQDQEWNGCLDGDRTGPVRTHAKLPDSVDDWLDTPEDRPVAQAFFPAGRGHSYQCLTTPFPYGATRQICFSGTRHVYYTNTNTYGTKTLNDAQMGCAADNPPILPLSNDATKVKTAIGALAPIGDVTDSALGVVWAQSLLESSWNATWGGGTHPIDPTSTNGADLRKVVVLLTDGEDTKCGVWQDEHCGGTQLGFSPTEACSAAKAKGTEIFVITAMHQDRVSDSLAETLRDCSSESDDSDNTYVFIGNVTTDDLESAFADIANQLRSVRRIN